jgi:hypothetical protein
MGDMQQPNDGEDVKLDHANGWAAYENVQQFLQIDGWYPEDIDGLTAYACRYVGTQSEFRVVLHINVELQQLYIYTIFPLMVPVERRSDMAELVTRANYGLRIGNFEMDFRDGELRYKASIDFEDVPLTHALIKNMIYPAVQTADRYHRAIMRVGFEGIDAAEAITEVEGRPVGGGEEDSAS